MTQKKEPFYLTTAIAYTSGRPHIGNTYEIILSDAIARFKRAQGYDVFFQTGTDEHGVKIEEKAKAAGVSPQEFVDGVAAQIKSNWDLMNTSYDYFVRTTDDYHVKEFLNVYTIKEISIKEHTKDGIVRLVNHSGQNLNW